MDLSEALQRKPRYKTAKQHMEINWHDIVKIDTDIPAVAAELKEKATLVARVGSMLLFVGTSAWRVRSSMNKISRALGISSNVDIGLTTLTYTCIEKDHHYTQTVALPTTGVNTDKLMLLECFVDEFPEKALKYSTKQFHEILDKIEAEKGNYEPWMLGFASAFACGAFTFLLGGGLMEIIFAFLGAGVGNYVRKHLLEKKITLLMNVMIGVATACTVYVASVKLSEWLFHLSPTHHAGYICSMLFIIPGFPLITGGIDLAKLDLRSGIERITYAVLIISVATLTGWVTALIFNFNPDNFPDLKLHTAIIIPLRIVASFIGIFGFSMMFNSNLFMALCASVIGMISNVLRLELSDEFDVPSGISAFLGALTSGLLASIIDKKVGVPRISITVPSIVIMVPGMYMYKAVYFIGLNDTSTGMLWIGKTILVVIALPLGLIFARILTDSYFRHRS
ncbi:DUF1212-domain-containing protein [Neocallimastix lanati (nom. inval.)]|jgi:uncharacterized membrane protein YjjP (DUF1212 family)|uniref:DUF1212-domain-containing protein n=1 Tax=Neocallimastix californiae TaxID=1754190 RepID=A0A1Y2BUT6_9FUNG|nr:DUF1212-domain-containing protein [Neocallimastix sp. JGI-2020a]ORY38503.1 DUF1212-domain-containing protein [Neocallimastix californiae]|eukprot:ORY38503.1 DUF1212-domain-containing protein [Neocallimastix californiae]